MVINEIKINKRRIGGSNPSYIIAEIGSNFDGSIKNAKKMIYEAKKAGADAAKFQSFKTEKIIEKNGFKKNTTFQNKWRKTVWDVYKDAELPLEWNKELNEYCKKVKIDFLSTPYYNEAVDVLIELKSPILKIGSGEITNLDFLKYVGKTKKPILLATGASTLKEVNEAVNVLKSVGNNKIILMQSITQYPSPINEANIRVLQTFQKKFKVNVGYSDHSPGDTVVLASIALGSAVIEKHFTLNRKLKGPDHPHSMEPKEFLEMVKKIRELEKALGDGIKKVENSEKQTRIIQRRGIWTTSKIKKGERFSRDNIIALRPVHGVSANKMKQILKKRSKRNIKANQPIKENDLK